jgi:putative Ig domain-containing protein
MTERAGFPVFFFGLVFALLLHDGCGGSPANSVVLAPNTSQTIGQGRTLSITATVLNDTSNAGVNWSLSPPTGSGTLGPTTKMMATYNAPPTVRVATTVTVTATSVKTPGQSATLSITVEPPPTITTTSLPSGATNKPYSGTVSASGGVPPFTWSVASGALPGGLSLASSTTNSVLISGTHTSRGSFTFTIKATDSTGASATSQSLTLKIESFIGNYAFEFSGFSSSGAVVVAGSFQVDGAGKITNGVEDFNSIQALPQNHTFTGTYTLGSDNRGTLVFSSLTGSPTYAFSIDPQGAHGRLVEFDSSGIRGSGEIEQQNITTCVSNTIQGEYAMGISGYSGSFHGFLPGPVVLAARFTAIPPVNSGVPGSLGNGEADLNTPGLVSIIPSSVSGNYQTTAQPAHCTATVTPASLPSFTFSVYPISATGGTLTEAFLVETDHVTLTSGTPYLTAGKLFRQVGFPFSGSSNSFTSTSVAGLSGEFLNTTTNAYLPDVAIVQMTATGGSFSMSVAENQAGTVTSGSAFPGNFVNADQFGRVATDLKLPIAPVFYLIDQNKAFCVGEINNNPFFGIFEPQSAGPFSASTIKGTFVEGTSEPTTNAVQDFSGQISLDGVSSVTGTQDVSPPGSANVSGETVTGTYQNIVPASGFGTLTLTAPASFAAELLIVSPTKFVLISTTAGDRNPVLVTLGH